MPFSLFLFFVFFILYLLNLKVITFNQAFLSNITLISGFVVFFLWFKKILLTDQQRTFLTNFSLFTSLLCTIITLFSYNLVGNFTFNIPKILTSLSILMIFFVNFIAFYINKNTIENIINLEHQSAVKNEEIRKITFYKNYPTINRIPVLRLVFGFFYKEKFLYLLILVTILSIFIYLKIPYLNLSFTGAHNMKYSAYVEPAKHMMKQNLLWNQLKYQADPITLPEGKFNNFGQYPIMEWGIVSVNKILPFFDLELNTRIYMAFLGIVLLIFIYEFLKIFLPKIQVFIVIFMLATNVIFQFFTYVTVLDPLNLICMFLSLIFFIKGLEQDNTKRLFLSGVIAGVGISIKSHALIFYTPIFIFFLIFYKNLTEERRIVYAVITLPNFLLQTIIFRISFRHLPENWILYTITFTLLVLIQAYIYSKINFIQSHLEHFLKNKVKFIYIIIVISIFSILYTIVHVSWVQGLFSDFITDKYLITNWQMYNTLVANYVEWLTLPVFYTSIFLLFSTLLLKNKKTKILLFSFLSSSFIYFVLTSKVLYFHEYYHHIIIFSFILYFSFIYYLTKLYSKLLFKSIFCLLVILVISASTYQNIKQVDIKLSSEKPETILVSNFLKSNLMENEYFIHSTDIYTSINFYSDRYSLVETLPTEYNKKLVEDIRESIIKNIPFGKIMLQHNIKLYVTTKSLNEKNNDFAYLFSQEDIDKKNLKLPERTAIILCKENNQCYEDDRFLKDKGSDIFEKKVKPHLLLIKQIDRYYIYQFQ